MPTETPEEDWLRRGGQSGRRRQEDRALRAEIERLRVQLEKQRAVIEAAQEIGPCWLSPGKPCGECLVCKLNRRLAALEGKLE